MFAKNWSDQPDTVTKAESLGRFTVQSGVGPVVVEVRKIGYNDGLFLTAGNLFGSQTIRIVDNDGAAAFRVISAISGLEKGQTLDLSKFDGAEVEEDEVRPLSTEPSSVTGIYHRVGCSRVGATLTHYRSGLRCEDCGVTGNETDG